MSSRYESLSVQQEQKGAAFDCSSFRRAGHAGLGSATVIFGVGTDIIEIARIEKMVARGKPYLETVFTDQEIEYCAGKARESQHYAVRYAAKEAALKALNTGWRDGLGFRDIEVVDDELGKPQLRVHGKVKELFESRHIQRTSISLSHARELAIAVIILET
jgi:holo-[acyl-carrier protein] synthase